MTDDIPDVEAELNRVGEEYGTGGDYVRDYVAAYERMAIGPPEVIAEEFVKQAELGIDQIIINMILGPGPAYKDLPVTEGVPRTWERIATEVRPLMEATLS